MGSSPVLKGELDMSVRLRNMTSLYLVDGKRALLLYRIGSRVADHKYIGSAGGHFEEKELNDPLACVLREAREELGLSPQHLTDLSLRYITHRLTQGEIRQNYYYFAKLKQSAALSSTEGQLQWVPYEKIEQLPMPVSAKHMILHYIREGQFSNDLYCGITREAGTDFVPLCDFPG